MTNMTSNSSSIEHTADSRFCTLATIILLITVLSVLFNIYAFWYLLQRHGNRKLVHVIVASLFASNLLQAALGYPFTIVTMLNVMPELNEKSRLWACQFSGLTVFTTALVSTQLIMILSVHRYILFTKPIHAWKINRKWRAGLCIVMTAWAFALIQAAYPFMGWGKLEASGYSCSFDYRQANLNTQAHFIYCLVLFYLAPIVTIVSPTLAIKKQCQSASKSCPTKSQKLYIRMEAAMMASFIICWCPYEIVSALGAANIDIATYTKEICLTFSKASSLVNSLVYYYTYVHAPSKVSPQQDGKIVISAWVIKDGPTQNKGDEAANNHYYSSFW